MYNVLVCDDEKDIVSALQIYLKSEGYQVFSAYNGKEALKIINREDIQLVLMDIMMPEMDGAQSGVFTPCDFAFPTDGKRAEATPNTEMILVSDVDLNLLNELHTYGSVRNLRDRRHDLYELKVKK